MTPNDGLVILISGRGSNALALIEASLDGRMAAPVRTVIADRAAPGLQAIAARGIETWKVPYAGFRDAREFEEQLAERIDAHSPRFVLLAGFMRVLSADFVNRFRGRLINIHPSLLPRHRGLRTHERALAAGDREHGASVHWVVPSLDAGPVIAQARLPVGADDDPDRLADRVLVQEHRLYPATLALLLNENVEMPDDDRCPPPPLLLDRDFDDAGRRLRAGPGNKR